MYVITQNPNTMGHWIGDVIVTGDSLRVMILTQAIDPIMGPDGTPEGVWTQTLSLPALPLGADPKQTVADWLVAEDNPYAGGTIVADDEFEFLAKQKDLRLKVKQARDQHEHAGVTVSPHGTFDSDPDSQRKISGAAVMAMLAIQKSEPFALDWRLQDNAIVTLDAGEMIDVGVAVGQHIAACQGRKNDLDALIDAAGTVEDLDAIDITTGWPA